MTWWAAGTEKIRGRGQDSAAFLQPQFSSTSLGLLATEAVCPSSIPTCHPDLRPTRGSSARPPCGGKMSCFQKLMSASLRSGLCPAAGCGDGWHVGLTFLVSQDSQIAEEEGPVMTSDVVSLF